MRRYYANSAAQVRLQTSATNGDVLLSINGDFTGWPTQYPYYAVLGLGTPQQEIVLVTNTSGSSASVERGQDGTAAVAHAAGETMDQAVVRADLDEANAHVNATSDVHGVTGELVGTTSTQTLTHKTLTEPTINGGTLVGVSLDAAVRVPHTFTISGSVLVPSGDTSYIPPFFVPVPTGKTASLIGVRSVVHSGGPVTCAIKVNGTAVTGLDALSVTTTAATVTLDTPLALTDGDQVALVVSAVSDTPKNLSLSVFIDYGI